MSDLFYDNNVFYLHSAISIVSSVEMWSCSRSLVISTGSEEPIGVFCVCFSNVMGKFFSYESKLKWASEYRPRHCVIIWNMRWFPKTSVVVKLAY